MENKCNNCFKENYPECEDYKPKMDAKEVIEIVKENILQIKELQNMFTGKMNTECQRDIDGFLMAIEALEKVEALEAENARLRERETPKEVIFDSGNRLCGECMEIIKAYESYCPFCGQAINNDKE